MEKIVHIVPLGYEIDRASKPFISEEGFRPNRVYLLTCLEENGTPFDVLEKHLGYYKKVKKLLESKNIEVIPVNTILINLFDIITKISQIIKKEQKLGSLVYINMSSAGRLTSVGATLAGMVHGVKVYYVESDGYSDTPEKWEMHGQTIVNDLRIFFLEKFTLHIPDKNKLKILVEIYNRKKMNTKDIIDFLVELKVFGFEKKYSMLSRAQKAAAIMKVSRRILSDLENSGYVKKIKNGRDNQYTLTQSGKYIAGISGLL
ncbi:MAG: DUF6293 family protein [Candidatus Hodarchaeota archaeon]